MSTAIAWRVPMETPNSTRASSVSAVTVVGAIASPAHTCASVVEIVRVAWSLTDLDGKDQPGPDQVNLAIALWLGVAQ